MARPSKPLSLVQGHRTNAEKKVRADAEASLLTGIPMKEWKNTKLKTVAHKEFLRVKKLLESIGKNDGLYESVINRYAMMASECAEFEQMIEDNRLAIEALDIKKDLENLPVEDYLKLKLSIQNQILSVDRQLHAKRDMMLKIERENIMTIAAALRSVPKQPEKKEKPGGMSAFLAQRADG